MRRRFQRRYTHLFIDEFQDTDPLQAELLLLLAADDPAITDWRQVRPVPGKLFVVGDPKQAIYRFRRADVGTYHGAYELLERAGARRVTLRTSFRARPNLQRLVNAAFEPAMAVEEAPVMRPAEAGRMTGPGMFHSNRFVQTRQTSRRLSSFPCPNRTGSSALPTCPSTSRCPTPSVRSWSGSSTKVAGQSPSAPLTMSSPGRMT